MSVKLTYLNLGLEEPYMAKHDSTKHTDDTAATVTPGAPTNGAGVPGTDDRYKKLAVDDAGSSFAYGDSSKSGQTVNRVDFIRSAWVGQRQARGAIAKEVSRLQGKKVTYQIIFAATKGVAGGPPAAAPIAPTATA